MKEPVTRRVAYLLVLGVSAKLLVDSSIQIFNPFLTIIAGGLGIGVISLGGLVALRGMMGLGAPFIGALADRIGYKRVLQVSLLTSGAGMLLGGLSRNIFMFIIAIVLTGLGQAGYTPNLHAYLSSRLPYSRRARGIGIVEYAWALAGIIGLSAAGYLMDAVSWRAPFILFGILLIIASAVYGTLPGTGNSIPAPVSEKKPFLQRSRSFFKLGNNAVSAWGTAAIQGLNLFAIMHVMIIHGGWLTGEYGLSASELGNVALLFGLTDLSASMLVSFAGDRIGKKKSVVIGVAGMTAGFVLMPFMDTSLWSAVIGLAIPRIFFEFATVSNLALMTEQVPEQRGKVMSLGTTAGLLGITAASALGPVTYLSRGVAGLAFISAAAGVLSLIILYFMIRDHSHHRIL